MTAESPSGSPVARWDAYNAADPTKSREAMVDRLRAHGHVRTDQVARAFQTVPRHLFTPDEHSGGAVSSLCAPPILALMLEQAEIGAGMRVLEIGSDAYAVALLAELVGDAGTVTTVHLDSDVVDRTHRCLATLGYPKIDVALAEDGPLGRAPYDRIIMTASLWDTPPSWVEQLAEDGRLVVPIRMSNSIGSMALEWVGGRLASTDLCGFVPTGGAGSSRPVAR